MVLKKLKDLRVDIRTIFKGGKVMNDYMKIILQRNQELLKLLDWYIAQNIYYRKKFKRLRKRNEVDISKK